MPDDVLELALVRHGRSTGNLGGRVLGHEMAPGLTDEGRRQARRVAASLAGWGAEALWSSDMVRARRTAEAIAATTGLPVLASGLLREQDHGRLDGRKATSLRAVETPAGLDISEVRWGGGESVADVYRRLRLFCTVLAARAPRRVVVVSHGDALCAFCSMLAGHGHREVDWDARPAHGEVRFVSWWLDRALPG